MEQFRRNGPEFQRLYNCTFYNVSDVPFERRSNVPIGILELLLVGTELILYLPCLISIWRHRKKRSCYKLMFTMGVLDVLTLISLLPNKYFLMAGMVYCSSPTIFYVLGCLFPSLWLAESSVEFVLALNRCINFLSPRCASILFGSSDSHSAGKKWEWLVAWLWVIPPIMLAIYHFFFCTPYIFSPILGTGSIPHQGYADNMFALYVDGHRLWRLFNLLFAIALPTIYVVFAFAILVKLRAYGAAHQNSAHHASQKKVAIISIVNSTFSAWTFIFSLIRWPGESYTIATKIHYLILLQTIGMPPIIYLVLNEMIRNDVREMIVGFVAVNLRLLSPETRVEIEHVSHMGPDEKGDGDDEVCNDGNNQQQRQQQQASEIVEMRPVGSDRQPPTDAAFSGQLALPRTPVFMTKRFLPMVQQRRNGRRSNKAREEMQKLHRVKFSAKLNKFVLS